MRKITDVDTLLAMAEIAKQGVMQLSLTEENNRIKFSENDNQVIVDQLLSETVYADGSVVEQRTNAAITSLTATSSYDGMTAGYSTFTVYSRIIYEYTIEGQNSKHYTLQRGCTSVTYHTLTSTYNIDQTLCYRKNDSIESYEATATHVNVAKQAYKYVYFGDEYNFPGVDYYTVNSEFYFYLESYVTINATGEVFLVQHRYIGDNEW